MALHIEKLPQTIVAMNMLDGHLLAYTADNVLRYYSLQMLGPSKLRLHLQQQLSLINMIIYPEHVCSIAWFPPPTSKLTIDSLKKSPILFLRNGELSLLMERGEGEWEHVILSNRVEFFWVSKYQERISDLYNSLWAFTGNGAKVGFLSLFV